MLNESICFSSVLSEKLTFGRIRAMFSITFKHAVSSAVSLFKNFSLAGVLPNRFDTLTRVPLVIVEGKMNSLTYSEHHVKSEGGILGKIFK